MATTTYKPMTEPQFAYLVKLTEQAYSSNPTLCTAKLLEAAGFDFTAASATIDALKAKVQAMPYQAKAKPVAQMPAYVPPPGHYLVAGVVVKITKPKWTGGPMYVFTDETYVGAVGFKGNAAISALSSPERAYAAVIAYSAKTARCGVCNTKLKDPESIAAGIGPVCAKKYGK